MKSIKTKAHKTIFSTVFLFISMFRKSVMTQDIRSLIMKKILCIVICSLILGIMNIQAQDEQWAYYYDGQQHNMDIARDIAYGIDGNIYITGDSYGALSGDFTIVSLSSSGIERWVYNYNGTGNYDDRAYSVIYGTDNNIYVAGYSEGIETGRDFMVVSLTSEGSERWTYRYDGSMNGDDRALSIVYGNDNNIYIAGKSRGIDTGDNLTVISLTSAGNERWIYNYDADSSYDQAYDIVYGMDNNIYIAGKSDTSETGNDFIIISLNSDGIKRWDYRYNGPDNLTDEALCIVYGSNNNIYAAGYSQSSSNGTDILVVGLDTLGSEQWTYRYNGAGNATDKAYNIDYGDDNNIYIAGESYTGSTNKSDFLVLSVNNSGAERWVYNYNGSGNDTDKANSISYGLDGNIYAGGITCGSGTYDDFSTISLTEGGAERWVYLYSGSGYYNYDRAYALVLGTDGNIYLAGSGIETTCDFTVVSINSGGSELWTYTYNGLTSGYDCISQIVYGLDGNIYGVGSTRGIYLDQLMLSVNNSGIERWVYTYNGPGNSDDWGKSIVYGSDGNIYSVGEIYEHNTLNDISIISMDNSGTERWIYQYNNPVDSNDISSSIAYGIDGNIYAAGYGRSGGTADDFVVLSVNTSGVERWVYTYNGTGNSDDHAKKITCGNDGNIYVAGESYGNGSFFDLVLISIDSLGQENWVYRYNGVGNSTDYPNSLVYGTDGNIYTAGFTYSSGTGGDIFVVSVDASGNERWVYRYNGSANGYDYANCIAYGNDGNIYVAGLSKGSSNSDDFIVISIDSLGNERWIYRYNGSANSYDAAMSITYGTDDNIHIGGASRNNDNSDFIVISLTPEGAERWIYRLNGSLNCDDYAFSMVYGTDNTLYAAGMVRNIGTLTDIAIVCLDPVTGIEKEERDKNLSNDFILQQNYPNPFNPSTTIEYSVVKPCNVQIKVYNQLGQEIRVLLNEYKPAGEYNVTWDGKNAKGNKLAGGVYFYRLTAGKQVDTKKMLYLQ